MRFFILTLLVFGLFLTPARAANLLCACCAEEAEYSIQTSKPDEYVLSQLKEMRFTGAAKLFTGSAEIEEAAQGIANPLDEYILSGSLDKNAFKLNFRTADNKTGTLSLPLPTKMLSYKVDPHTPGESTDREPGAMITLYKEWRFEGAASGTGFFKPGFTAAAKYFLVLQGRGNRCDNASDFTHWRLEIGGKKAGYAFYGKLGETVPAPPKS